MAGRVRWMLLFAFLLLAVSVYLVNASGCVMGGGADYCRETGDGIGGVVDGVLDIPGAIVAALFSMLGAIADAFAGIIRAVVDLLPDAGDLHLSVPSGWIVGYSWIDRIVPLHEALVWMGVLAAAAVAPIVYHLGITLYHLILKPGMGT